MALTLEQRRIRDRIVSIGSRRGATKKEIKAALETGLVESNLQNLPGGDADSAGWRQERASIYKDPTNLDASIERFFDETKAVRDKYANSGDLAAAVQRPAAQYRGRYAQRSGEAEELLGGAGASASSSRARGGSPRYRTTTTTTPGVDNRAARAALVQSFLQDKNADPVQFATQSVALQDVAPTSQTTRQRLNDAAADGTTSGAGGGAGTALARASAINKQRLPYKWGGGHAGKTPLHDAVPLDCSGAVSKVLGIDPRVSGDFNRWGRPGDGGAKGITVYSNPKHVFMKINGHFFGTSGSNPGGGAGWIPAGQMSSQYLQGFTARHSNA
jgi:hypothetical protein